MSSYYGPGSRRDNEWWTSWSHSASWHSGGWNGSSQAGAAHGAAHSSKEWWWANNTDPSGWNGSGAQSWYGRSKPSEVKAKVQDSEIAACPEQGTAAWSKGLAAAAAAPILPKAKEASLTSNGETKVKEPKEPGASLLRSPEPKVPASRAPPPQVLEEMVAKAVMAAKASKSPDRQGEEEELPDIVEARAASYSRALQLCACCPGKEEDGLAWMEEMQENENTRKLISIADYLAALHACEACEESLLRAFAFLTEMHKSGLSLDTPLQLSEGAEQEGVAWLKHKLGEDVWDALEHHADSWLSRASQSAATCSPYKRSGGAVLRLGSLLRRSSRRAGRRKELDELDEKMRPWVQPMMDALDSDSPAALTKLKETPDLGAFAADSLRHLGIIVSDANGWPAEAAQQLRRKAMLDKWLSWGSEGPGSLAWMAFDLTHQLAGHLHSAGETYCRGHSVVSPLMPLDETFAGDAEQVAMQALAQRLLEAGGEPENFVEVRGVVLLYMPSPPRTAGIFAAKQFLQLFPLIQMHMAFGDGMDLGGLDLPIIRIGNMPSGKAQSGDKEALADDRKSNGKLSNGHAPNGVQVAMGRSA